MRNQYNLGGLAFLALGLFTAPALDSQACTTVGIPKSDEKIVAKSYDWHQGHGAVVMNLKGLDKTALIFTVPTSRPIRPGTPAPPAPPVETPVKWKSGHASVTFNQHGREFPLGGMNDAGLVVEIMWLDTTVYPKHDTRKVLNELQWIQYTLDKFATVEEMLTPIEVEGKKVRPVDTIRVAPVMAQVHYMVCDATGACATFEYLKGSLVVSGGGRSTTAKVPTLTNTEYAPLLTELASYVGFGGTQSIPTGGYSLDRFVRASAMADAFDPKGTVTAVDHAFGILDSVGGSDYTKFHIVYEPKAGKVHFRTFEYKDRRTIELAKLKPNWDCQRGVEKTRFLDMNQKGTGDISASLALDSSHTLNRTMINAATRDMDPSISYYAARELTNYPLSSSVVCK